MKTLRIWNIRKLSSLSVLGNKIFKQTLDCSCFLISPPYNEIHPADAVLTTFEKVVHAQNEYNMFWMNKVVLVVENTVNSTIIMTTIRHKRKNFFQNMNWFVDVNYSVKPFQLMKIFHDIRHIFHGLMFWSWKPALLRWCFYAWFRPLN